MIFHCMKRAIAMKIQNKDIPNYKAIAEINLSALLLKNYVNKDFLSLEFLIKKFLKEEIPKTFQIKSYKIYQEIIDIEWNKFQYVFLSSLKNLNKDNLLTRARLDSSLLINMPTQILLLIDKIYANKSVFKSDSEEEDYLIGLITLFPNLSLKSNKNVVYSNKEIVKLKEKEVENISVSTYPAKKKFKEYAKKVEENKDKQAKLKEIEEQYNNDTIELTSLSVIAKKIFFQDVWMSSFLANSRSAHKSASGQKRNYEGFFIVGGEKFRYCGDWAYASVSNVINCRCYLINNY